MSYKSKLIGNVIALVMYTLIGVYTWSIGVRIVPVICTVFFTYTFASTALFVWRILRGAR